MNSIIPDGESAVTFPHAAWCDPAGHDDGSQHPNPDPNWQICFSTPHTLEFGDRTGSEADLETVTATLGFSHLDVWGERADVLVHLDLNMVDGPILTPDQLLPIGKLLLSLDALYKGETELSEALMAEARAAVVELVPDLEREERREAARRAWQAEQDAQKPAASA